MPIDEVIAEGDRVLIRLRLTGRHTGTLTGTPATTRTVDVAVRNHIWIADEGLAKYWAPMDNLTLLKQVGAVAT